MANFKVVVELTARVQYEVMVEDVDSELEAEIRAINQWREKLPEDFQVDKGYIENWETEAEQTSWDCQECHEDIPREEYEEFDEMCGRCYAGSV
jgi:hypothetical protein